MDEIETYPEIIEDVYLTGTIIEMIKDADISNPPEHIESFPVTNVSDE